MHQELLRAYFQTDVRAMFGLPPLSPPTWKDRLRWKRQRVTGYFSTLWLAIKGADLREGDDDDY